MRRALVVLLVAVAVPSSVLAAAPVVRVVDFDIEVTSASSARIVQAIDDAEREGDALVLIRLDTPGGSVGALETIQKRMLGAKVPIVAWVGPSGARAASAGFLLLIAADVAAMAPGTRTGAASPVTAFGGDIPETLKKKVENDLAAGARSIAEHRGRNVEKIEKAVLEATAYSDQDALKEGLIDVVAQSREDLLEKLDGRTIRRFDGSSVVLATRGAAIARSERTWKQEFWETLASPTLAFLLLVLGVIGLYTEFTHPGLTFPGVAGALCLLLFALASQVLPVSLIGILLIVLGIVMLILELKIVSHGLLTIGGIACVVIGSLLLIPGPIPELRVPLVVVLPGSLTLAGFCALAVRLSVAARRAPVATGVEGLRGETGVVEDALAPEGKVFVHGELWNAVSTAGAIPRGASVRVVSVEGMRIVVEPSAAPAGGKA
jgi:membrane-bound serine protease (ClpP class)